MGVGRITVVEEGPVGAPLVALTADVVALAAGAPLRVLLVRRGNEPFKGDWALPGGFVEERERARDAAVRELEEETGVVVGDLSLVGVYDEPDRDPRGRVVSIAYRARLESSVTARGGSDASEARWFSVEALPTLAFDHARVIREALVGA